MKNVKSILFGITFIFSGYLVNAQWNGTNPVYTNSNVGIGTDLPLEKLDVRGNVISTGLKVDGQTYLNNTTYFGMSGDKGRITWGSDNTFSMCALNSRDLALGTSSGYKMFIQSTTGNVGIGTPSPAYALDVSGTINASNILVNGQAVSTGSSLWNTNGSDIFYDQGNIGIGGAPGVNSHFQITTHNAIETQDKIYPAIKLLEETGQGFSASLESWEIEMAENKLNFTHSDPANGQVVFNTPVNLTTINTDILNLKVNEMANWTFTKNSYNLLVEYTGLMPAGITPKIGFADPVGIGTDSPSERLHVVGNTVLDGNVGIRTETPELALDVNGKTIFRNNTIVDGQLHFGTSDSYSNGLISSGPESFEITGAMGRDLILKTNYNPRLVIKANGTVGIGTIDPIEKLNIAGMGDQFIRFDRKETDYYDWKMGATVIDDEAVFAIQGGADGESLNNLLAISGNGNVGIGPASPAAKLEVVSNDAHHNGNPTLLVKDLTDRGTMILESAIDNPTDFVFKNNGESRVWLSSRGSSNDYRFDIWMNEEPDGTGSPDIIAMTILKNGNVGIGTANPTAKLAVNGKILAEEIEVVSSITSDFVFEDSYKLRTLAEVESYIKENKHLPEIPSVEEFKEKGQNLAEMDDLLLRKVEELTLYSIEQNKQIQNQQQLIQNLQKQINNLQK